MVFFSILAFFLPPFAQPQDYHHFVDERVLAGIPRALDVLSNLGFFLAGAWGLWEVHKPGSKVNGVAALAMDIFFLGVLGTAFGSAYYHWSPVDARLFWDRLPMTIAFAGVFSALATTRVSERSGRFVLFATLVYGVASIAIWRSTGNLMPYAIMQFGGLAWVAVAWVSGSVHKLNFPWGALLGFYLAAKFMESFDTEVFSATLGLLSGHTIKHLLCALASASFAWAMSNGRLDS